MQEPERCWFCGKPRREVRQLAVGFAPEGMEPPAICNECVGVCTELLRDGGPEEDVEERRRHCSFCGRRPRVAAKSPPAPVPCAVCVRCVEQCQEMMEKSCGESERPPVR